MRLIFRLNGWLVRILCVVAIVVMSAMALGVSAEVILRIFKFPSIIGLIELTEYGLFISTFFMAPHLLRTNEHIRVDIAMSDLSSAFHSTGHCPSETGGDFGVLSPVPKWRARRDSNS